MFGGSFISRSLGSDDTSSKSPRCLTHRRRLPRGKSGKQQASQFDTLSPRLANSLCIQFNTTMKYAIVLATATSAGAFTVPPSTTSRLALKTQLSAHDSANDDIIRRVSTSAAGFFTGVGIMAQLAFADPSALQEGERQCLIIPGEPRRRAT